MLGIAEMKSGFAGARRRRQARRLQLPLLARVLIWPMVAVSLAMPVAGETRSAEATGISRLSEELVEKIDEAAEKVLEETGVPSASIAVVQDGEIAMTRAYGLACLEPEVAATPDMRYPIGSISKQFISTAVVMLAEEGQLDLDAPIARFYPKVTQADEITLRQLLSHTSGIRDYWPQDYVPPMMLEPITTEELINQHASTEIIKAKAQEQGVRFLRQDGWQKVQQGITTISEVLRVTLER